MQGNGKVDSALVELDLSTTFTTERLTLQSNNLKRWN